MVAYVLLLRLLCGGQIHSRFIFPLYIIIYILKFCYIFVICYGMPVFGVFFTDEDK